MAKQICCHHSAVPCSGADVTTEHKGSWGHWKLLCTGRCSLIPSVLSVPIFILPNGICKSAQMKNKLPASDLIASLPFTSKWVLFYLIFNLLQQLLNCYSALHNFSTHCHFKGHLIIITENYKKIENCLNTLSYNRLLAWIFYSHVKWISIYCSGVFHCTGDAQSSEEVQWEVLNLFLQEESKTFLCKFQTPHPHSIPLWAALQTLLQDCGDSGAAWNMW